MPSVLSSMIRSKVIGGLAATALLIGGGAMLLGGNDEKEQAAPASRAINLQEDFSGRWNIRYYDRILGPVSGHAFIDKSGEKGAIELDYPIELARRYYSEQTYKKSYPLKVEAVKQTAEGIRFNLTGDWPGAPMGMGHDIGASLGQAGQAAEADFENTSLKISLDGKQEAIDFKAGKQSAAKDSVQVTLRAQGDSFAGKWEYPASGWRGVEADGNGRIYKLARDADGNMKAYGYETWVRPEPVVELVAPLPHLSQYNHHPANGGSDARSILVLGKDLPHPGKETIRVTLLGDAEGEKHFGYGFRKPDTKQLSQLMPTLRNQLSEADYTRLKTALDAGQLDAMMITAMFGKDARPGLTHFRISDGHTDIELSWLLTFDDYVADMQFARKLVDAASLDPLDELAPKYTEGDDASAHEDAVKAWAKRAATAKQDVYEPTANLFTPDAVYVTLHTDKELPYTSLPLMFGRGEDIITFNGGRTLFARKDPEMPTRFVAGPIMLGGGGTELKPQHFYPDTPLPKGARLSVRVNHTHHSLAKKHWLLKTTSPIISAQVIGKPQNDVAQQGGKRRKLFTTWQGAYEVVRQCYLDLRTDTPRYAHIDDPYRGSVLKVDEYRHYIVNNVFQGKDITRETPLLMGDHAAMFLLRDTYLAMMERQRSEMQRALKNAYGYYQLMRPYSRVGKVPKDLAPAMMHHEVSMPDGSDLPLYDAYYTTAGEWYSEHQLSGKALREMMASMARTAITKQIKDIEANMQLVWAAHRCDKDQLIEMTQRYYRVVAPQTFKKLYKQPEDGGLYQADAIARAWVRGQYWLSENQRTEAQLNKADTYMLMGEVAAIGMIPAAIGTASSLGSAGIAYLAGTGGAAASGAATTALAAESAFSMAGLWSAVIAAVEIADLGYSSYMTYSDLSDYHEDLAFARTSQALMGYHQYKQLEDKRLGTYGWAGFDMVLGAIGAHGTGHAIMHAGQSLKSYSNASKMVQQAFIGDAAALYARRGTLVQDSAQWATHSLGAARETGGLIYHNMRQKIAQKLAGSMVLTTADQSGILKQVKALMAHEGIDAASHSDKAILQMAERLGAPEFARAKQMNYPQAMARRRTSQRIVNEMAGANTPMVDRVLSGAEITQSTAEGRKTLAQIYTEIMALPQADREMFAQWLRQFQNLGENAAGNPALARHTREVMAVYEHLQDLLDEKALYSFADSMNASSFERLLQIMHPTLRQPLQTMAEQNPKRFATLFESELGERVLRGNAFENLDQYERAIELEKTRVRSPNQAGWDEIANHKPRGLYSDEALGKLQPDGSRNVKIDVSTNWNWGEHSNRFAHFERRVNNVENLSEPIKKQMRGLGLPETGKIFTFASAKIDDLAVAPRIIHARDAALNAMHAATAENYAAAKKAFLEAQKAYDDAAEYALSIQKRSMISNMKNPMIAGKGTPLSAYLNQRAMQLLGIGFGDPALKVVQLESVFNKKTALQLHWLQQVYPNGSMPIDEMLSFTDSYRYAESALNQAGFKVTGAKLYNERLYTEMAGAVSEFAANTNSHSFGKEGLSGFLKRFSAIDPREKVKVGFDIYLTVEPIK